MFSYFQSNSTVKDDTAKPESDSQVAVGEPVQSDLAAIDDRQKDNIVRNIENCKYKRRRAGMIFRKSFGLKDYIMRMVVLLLIYLIAVMPKYSTPRHREDAQWL